MIQWFYLRFVPPYHRSYLQQHPLAFWVAMGWFAAGLLQIVAVVCPGAFGDAVAVHAFPPVLQVLFAGMYSVGGFFAAFGIMTARARFEASGLVVLAAVLFAWMLGSAYIRGWTAVPVSAWLIFNSIGCLRRASVLVHRGYDNDWMRVDLDPRRAIG